jgi:hypothetical protein
MARFLCLAVVLTTLGSRMALAQGDGTSPFGFDCKEGPHAATWQSVKKQFRNIFNKDGTSLIRTPKKVLTSVMESVMKELKDSAALKPDSKDQCGLGRLSLQLLSFTTLPDEALMQLFASSEQVASPVLTMLLDTPWLAVAQSGWPIMGLLAEINLQKRASDVINKAEVDGLDKPVGVAFHTELTEALVKGNSQAFKQVTNLYLLGINDKDRSTIATLTALAAHAVSSDIKERMQAMDMVQDGLKQAIGNAMELDILLGTQWHLWGLMHIAVEPFMM